MPILRPLTIDDCPILAALHARSFPENSSWSVQAFTSHLALPTTQGFGGYIPGTSPKAMPDRGTTTNNMLHGFIILQRVQDTADILTLCVDPDTRRQGLGRALVAQTLTVLAPTQTITLDVSLSNHAAQALYIDQGFYQTGLRPGYYADGTDAIILCRDSRERTLARLRFRARQRGLRETTALLGKFAETTLPTLSDADQAAFARVLDVDDLPLMAWLTYNPAATTAVPTLESEHHPEVPPRLRHIISLIRSA